jgi:hypothetical protein
MTRDPSAAAASVQAAFFDALARGESRAEPYPHWLMEGLFPGEDLVALQTLPYPAPDLGGVSGTREAHNNTRVYFDVANQQKFPICHAVSSAFQDPALVGRLAKATGADLDGTFLRIEYAQDTGGFWLKPHTDIGVKRFTLLAYLSDEPGHADLGTDIYADASTWFAPLAVRRQQGDGVRAVGPHLARLRAADDHRRPQVADHQLRHRRLAGARATELPAGAGAGGVREGRSAPRPLAAQIASRSQRRPSRATSTGRS